MSKLSIIVPVYNEAPHLEKVLTYLFKSTCPIEREWIIVEDCSSDDSLKVLTSLKSKMDFTLIEHKSNEGKGAAIRDALKVATGDLVMIQDADFEYDPADVPTLLEPLLNRSADVVYGSRFRQSAFQVHRTYHYFVNRILTILSNLLSGIYLTDMETCYKVFRSDLIKPMQIKSKRFGVEIELTAYVAKTAARLYELPIRYYPRTKLQGKKINWKDGVAALFHLVRFNLIESRENAFIDLPRFYLPSELRHSSFTNA